MIHVIAFWPFQTYFSGIIICSSCLLKSVLYGLISFDFAESETVKRKSTTKHYLYGVLCYTVVLISTWSEKPDTSYNVLFLCNLFYTKWANMQQKQERDMQQYAIRELIIVCGTILFSTSLLLIQVQTFRILPTFALCTIDCHSLIRTISS